ncbi:MAG: VWA domain-containing protein, partial [Spirochaetes bacterium]|nr:VWA domain-containing protein [Spirochaetota bacterium]
MKRGKRGDLGDLDNRGKLGDREKRGRRFLVAALVFAFLFSGSGNVWAQSPSPHLMMPIDLVLVLDTSAGMSFSYNEVLDYITGPFLREFLRVGDTFHLITFASAPALCISRRISGIGDIETVIGRMLLHPPLGAYASLEGALAFAESFVQSLPASRPGEVVLLSSAVGAASLVEGSRQRLSESGANLHFVAVGRGGDLAGLPASGRPSAVAAPPAAVAPPPAV